MAAKQPVKTTTNTVAANNPPLPPPEIFEICSLLHELVARVDKHDAQNNPLTSITSEEHDDSDIACIYPDNIPGHEPLAPKDFAHEVLNLKSRVRAALRDIEKLPDIDRSTQEQEEEMRELEERIRKQREVLGNLAEVARGMQGRVS